jgi:hypothetical protein
MTSCKHTFTLFYLIRFICIVAITIYVFFFQIKNFTLKKSQVVEKMCAYLYVIKQGMNSTYNKLIAVAT